MQIFCETWFIAISTSILLNRPLYNGWVLQNVSSEKLIPLYGEYVLSVLFQFRNPLSKDKAVLRHSNKLK